MPPLADAVGNLVAVGISPTVSALPIREKIAALAGRDIDLLMRIRQQGVDDAVLLSTDERLEYIGHAAVQSFRGAVQSTLAEVMAVPEEDLADQVFLLTGVEALRHLFIVAACLDDLIPGGSQAWEKLQIGLALSRQQGMVSHGLAEVIESAIRVAEKVHSVTEFSSKPVSMAGAAARIAKDIFGDLSTSTLLVWGNHEGGIVIANRLHQSGFKRFMSLGVAGDSFESVNESVKQAGSDQLPGGIYSFLIKADVVVCAPVNPPFSVTQNMMRQVLKQRKNRPIFLIDATIPGVVDPMVADLDGVFLYDLNDLEQVVMEGRNSISDDIAVAWSIIEEGLQQYIGVGDSRSAVRLPSEIRCWVTDCFPGEGAGSFSDELIAFLTNHLNALPDAAMRRNFIDHLGKMMKLNDDD